MSKIPTAEEFWTNFKGTSIEALQEFAKLHVKAALEEASEKGEANIIASVDGELFTDGKVYKNSILNAYPLNKIK